MPKIHELKKFQITGIFDPIVLFNILQTGLKNMYSVQSYEMYPVFVNVRYL